MSAFGARVSPGHFGLENLFSDVMLGRRFRCFGVCGPSGGLPGSGRGLLEACGVLGGDRWLYYSVCMDWACLGLPVHIGVALCAVSFYGFAPRASVVCCMRLTND